MKTTVGFRRERVWVYVVASLAVLAAIVAMPASADKAWFTYARPAYTSQYSLSAGAWGGSGSEMYYQIDNPNLDNVIWPNSAAFYTNGGNTESWFDSGPRDRCLQIHIYNASAVNFTGVNRLKVKIYKANGDLADGNARWVNIGTGQDTNHALINTSANSSPFEWDSANSQFLVTLSSKQRIMLGSHYSTYNLFSTPNDPELFGATICIEQPNNYAFEASTCGWSSDHFRVGVGLTSGAFETFPYMWSWGYEASYESSFPLEDDNAIVLPYFREKHSTSSSIAEWTTVIRVVNASDSSDTIDIVVLHGDGTTVKSKSVTLAAHAAFQFTPSQFYSSATQDEGGMVRITGRKPVATAMQMRFPKTDYTCSSQLSRMVNVTFMPFFTY